MLVLHTADWHLGKKLGRFERYEEMGRFIDWMVDECRQRAVDLVLIAGDLFDTPSPPNRAVGLATDALRRLTGQGAKVVVISGNHDSPDFFENLNQFSELHGVHLVGRLQQPNDGGILRIQTRAGPAAVACCPYVREHNVVDFFSERRHRHHDYKEHLGQILAAFDDELANYADCVRLLVGHLAVDGAALRRARESRRPRGERILTIGNTYVLEGRQLPANAQYTALGHLHSSQRVPSPAGQTRYSGSPLALEFGESGDRKQIVLVEAVPDRRARVKTIDVGSIGRQLLEASGSWEELVARREEFGDDYLSLTVTGADAPRALLQRAAETFPMLVRAHLVSADAEALAQARNLDRDWSEIYAEYVNATVGKEPPEGLMAEFKRIYAVAASASD
ncbi:MAG: exonuclease SbcCD subunit D [Chloroflexi bacterium]|nr:exonuclease SbcCD subunit D [Chloroflexota bacterium]MYC48438.1 exonuclease SbcCD subunit D [Chloroflexota bacterium]